MVGSRCYNSHLFFFIYNKESEMPRRMHLRNARSDLIIDLVDTRRELPEDDVSDQREPTQPLERESTSGDHQSVSDESGK